MVVLGLIAAPALMAGATVEAASLSASVQQSDPPPPPQVPKVDVDINTDRGGAAWYSQPIWLAIGAIALIVVVALLVMAGRGGGTTVVRG
jgi:hypothetical protein